MFNFKFHCGRLIAYHNRFRMELQAANGHMWLTLPSTAACSAGFLMAQHQNHHFFRIQQRACIPLRQRVFRLWFTSPNRSGSSLREYHVVNVFDTGTGSEEDAGSLKAIASRRCRRRP